METITRDQLEKDKISEIRIHDLSEIETNGLKAKGVIFYTKYIDHVDIEDIEDHRIGKHKYSPQNIIVTLTSNEVLTFRNSVYLEVNKI